MPGVIGMLVNRIKSGLTAKVFKLFVASIIAVGMLFGIVPACESHAAFAQNIPVGGGIPNQATSLNANGAADAEKTEDPNDLFANNPTLKQALYDSIKEYKNTDINVPESYNDWKLTANDAKKIKKLGLSNKSISDISFLKYFPNLEDLNLSENKISDISQLASLTNLKNLNLSWNNISDITKLSGLTNLESLDISTNKISNVDSLVGLCNGKLKTINAKTNNISNVYNIYTIAYKKNISWNNNVDRNKYNCSYDFSDQHIEKNITPSDAINGYNVNQIVKPTKIKDADYIFNYRYAYMNFFDIYHSRYTFTNELIHIDKNDGVKLIDFDLNKKLGENGYNGTSTVHYGPDFRFNGRLLIRQYVIKRINIEVNFGQSIDFRNALKNSKLSGYSGKISDLGLEFCGYDPWAGYTNSNSPDDWTAFFPGKETFEFPVCYKNGEFNNHIEGYFPADNLTFIVTAKTMAQTWPAKSSDVKIDNIDSSSKNPPAKQPTVDSIKTDVKKQVEGLFTTTSRLNYPLIPEGKTPSACDLCDPNKSEDGCSSACQNDDDNPDDGFSSDSRPYYYNDDNDRVYPIKIGDSYYKSCYNVDDPDACTTQYYYKAPTVTVDDFKIPEATDKDQTVEVPVTVSYVDGSKCTFKASFTVKAKPQLNPPTPKPQPQPQPVTPQPQPHPQPVPEPQPHPVTPTPQPTPTPDPQNPPVTPAPAPTPDQPETPSGQSHMTEPEILPKPYLNIDVTPDSNIGTTPNTGSENSNTPNPYLNQKPDASRNGASKNGVAFAKSANRHKTAAGINSASHKSRGTIPATGSESSLIAIVAMLSILLGVVAICKCKFKQYIL